MLLLLRARTCLESRRTRWRAGLMAVLSTPPRWVENTDRLLWLLNQDQALIDLFEITQSSGVLGERHEEFWERHLEDGGKPGEGDASAEQHARPNGERSSPAPAHPAQPGEDVLAWRSKVQLLYLCSCVLVYLLGDPRCNLSTCVLVYLCTCLETQGATCVLVFLCTCVLTWRSKVRATHIVVSQTISHFTWSRTNQNPAFLVMGILFYRWHNYQVKGQARRSQAAATSTRRWSLVPTVAYQ